MIVLPTVCEYNWQSVFMNHNNSKQQQKHFLAYSKSMSMFWIIFRTLFHCIWPTALVIEPQCWKLIADNYFACYVALVISCQLNHKVSQATEATDPFLAGHPGIPWAPWALWAPFGARCRNSSHKAAAPRWCAGPPPSGACLEASRGEGGRRDEQLKKIQNSDFQLMSG